MWVMKRSVNKMCGTRSPAHASHFIHSLASFHPSTHLGVTGYYKSSPCSFFLSHFPSFKYILCWSLFPKSTCFTICLYPLKSCFPPFLAGNPVQFIHSPRCKQKKYADINSNQRRKINEVNQVTPATCWLARVRDRQCSQWLVVVTTLIRRTDTVTATETKHNKKKPRLLIPISSANDGKEGKPTKRRRHPRPEIIW